MFLYGTKSNWNCIALRSSACFSVTTSHLTNEIRKSSRQLQISFFFSLFLFLPSHSIWYCSQDALHHCQVLTIVVCLEECDSQIKFKHNTTDAKNNFIRSNIGKISWKFSMRHTNYTNLPNWPYIAWLRPTELQNHLRCSIMSRRNDCTVMFMIECCTTKVNQSNVGAFYFSYFTTLHRV